MTSSSDYHNPMLNARPDETLIRADLMTRSYPAEIRMMNMREGYARTLTGIFTHPEPAIAAVLSFTGAQVPGIYGTFNPLKAYTLNWGYNRLGRSVVSAGDADVARITGFYLDLDSVRPRFTCATEEEHRATKARGNQIVHYVMTELGFPMPVFAGSSGSGSMARWIIDLAVEDAPLLARCLAALDAIFSDDEVKVDTTVANPARVSRIAGTINAKSPTPQPDRPWRMATGKAFETTIVTREQLEALAALAPKAAPAPRRNDGPYDGPAYNLRKLLDEAGIEFTEKKRTYGTAYDLASCLTSNEHDTGASFIQFDSGAVAYRCLHDSCAGKGWQDVKHRLGIREITARLTTRGNSFTPIKIGANGRVAS